MAKCPECGTEIEDLTYRSYTLNEYRFTIDSTKTGTYDFLLRDNCEEIDISYCCPKCSEELFYNEPEATDFLIEKDEEEEEEKEGGKNASSN